MSATKIPDRYQFTENDFGKSIEICFGRLYSNDERVSSAVTEAEKDFMYWADEAHKLFCLIKRWPTMRELRQHLERQEHAKQSQT